jgi:hypothetical protein
LLDDVADLLEAVGVSVCCAVFGRAVGDDKERGSLEEDDLVGIHDLGKALEMSVEGRHVRDEGHDDRRPRLVVCGCRRGRR